MSLITINLYVCADNREVERLLNEVNERSKTIMSAISDFAAKQNAHNDAIDQSISGLQADIQALNDAIKKLQDSAGQITPEDQALLDAIDARGQTVADKLAALDALTPPAPPAG